MNKPTAKRQSAKARAADVAPSKRGLRAASRPLIRVEVVKPGDPDYDFAMKRLATASGKYSTVAEVHAKIR
jgi:hypothetical protein